MTSGNEAQQIAQKLKKSSSVALCIASKANLDAITAGLALYDVFNSAGKTVSIASPEPIQLEYELPYTDHISSRVSAGGDTLVVSIPYEDSSIEDVTYNVENNMLNILITPENGISRLNPDDVRFDYTGGKPDAIITLFAPTLDALGALYENNSDMFQGTELINIDRHFTNSEYGTINYLDKRSPSLCLMVNEILKAMRAEVSQEAATLLYAGLSHSTNNFAAFSVGPDAFKMAAFLLERGAMKIVGKPSEQNNSGSARTAGGKNNPSVGARTPGGKNNPSVGRNNPGRSRNASDMDAFIMDQSGLPIPQGMPQGASMPQGMPQGMTMPQGMPQGMTMPQDASMPLRQPSRMQGQRSQMAGRQQTPHTPRPDNEYMDDDNDPIIYEDDDEYIDEEMQAKIDMYRKQILDQQEAYKQKNNDRDMSETDEDEADYEEFEPEYYDSSESESESSEESAVGRQRDKQDAPDERVSDEDDEGSVQHRDEDSEKHDDRKKHPRDKHLQSKHSQREQLQNKPQRHSERSGEMGDKHMRGTAEAKEGYGYASATAAHDEKRGRQDDHRKDKGNRDAQRHSEHSPQNQHNYESISPAVSAAENPASNPADTRPAGNLASTTPAASSTSTAPTDTHPAEEEKKPQDWLKPNIFGGGINKG